MAYRSIHEIIEITKEKGNEIDPTTTEQFRSIVQSVRQYLRERMEKSNFIHRGETVFIKCMHTVAAKMKKEKLEQTFSREEIDDLTSLVMFHGLYEQTVRFVLEIARQDVHNSSDVIEKKLIIIVSKILTNSYKSFPDKEEIAVFLKELEVVFKSSHF